MVFLIHDLKIQSKSTRNSRRRQESNPRTTITPRPQIKSEKRKSTKNYQSPYSNIQGNTLNRDSALKNPDMRHHTKKKGIAPLF